MAANLAKDSFFGGVDSALCPGLLLVPSAVSVDTLTSVPNTVSMPTATAEQSSEDSVPAPVAQLEERFRLFQAEMIVDVPLLQDIVETTEVRSLSPASSTGFGVVASTYLAVVPPAVSFADVVEIYEVDPVGAGKMLPRSMATPWFCRICSVDRPEARCADCLLCMACGGCRCFWSG